jgi:NADH-quinone oxidoreductase subunit G
VLEYADVLLPVVPFSETSGTFVNTDGQAQSFRAVVKPQGEARPAWKVLRVLGNLLDCAGFDYESTEAVRAELLAPGADALRAMLNNQLEGTVTGDMGVAQGGGLQRIGEVPMYQADAIVRRAPSLQSTPDGAAPVAWMNSTLLQRLGVLEGTLVKIRQGDEDAVLKASCDDQLPADCVRIAAAHPLTAGLGDMLGEVVLERVQSSAP